MTYDFAEFKSITGRSIMELNDTEGRIQEVGPFAFAGCRSLNSVILPSCRSAVCGAFMGCALRSTWSLPMLEAVPSDIIGATYSTGVFAYANVYDVSFPALKNIGANAFERATIYGFPFSEVTSLGGSVFKDAIFYYLGGRVSEVTFGSLVQAGAFAFGGCKVETPSVMTWNFPVLTSVGGSTFAFDTGGGISPAVYLNFGALTSIPNVLPRVFGGYGIFGVSMPLIETLPEGCFSLCSSMVSAYLPALKSVPNLCFGSQYGNNQFANIYAPNVEYIGSSAFVGTNLSEVSFPKCSVMNRYAFSSCRSLERVYLPSLTVIPSNAFYNCPSLTSVDISNCTEIGSNAFSGCTALSSIYFPSVTTISGSAFMYCRALADVNLPVVTSIKDYTFAYCSALSIVSFSMLTTISGALTFNNCSSLAVVSLPALTEMSSQQTFYQCYNLSDVYIPQCSIIGQFAFGFCSALATISLPSCGAIYGSAFAYCSSLSEIHIGTSNCTLSNSNAFLNTGIKHNTGSIYVPAEYVEAYKASTNWVYFSTQIVAEP